MPVEINPEDPLFTIGVASRLTGLSAKQLRLLEQKGIIGPARSQRSRRLYSLNQLNRLRYVSYLVGARHANTAGVQVALELLERLPEEERNRVLAEAEEALGETKEVAPELWEDEWDDEGESSEASEQGH